MKRIALFLASAASLAAAPVYWTDWTFVDTQNVIHGEITLPDASTVGVTYTGSYYFAQIASPGTNYWSPDAYTGGDVGNAPDSLNQDIIAVGTGAGGTFAFSSPILNPIFAVVSLNGPTLQFDAPFAVQHSGCGYWGCDTLTAFSGNVLGSTSGGEGHGSIEFQGNYSSLSFTESGAENWRGLTVGITGAATPEPSAGFLALGGVALLGLLRRRRA